MYILIVNMISFRIFSGEFVYYRDFSNNIIEVNLVNHTQEPIFTFEQWVSFLTFAFQIN